MFDSLDEDGYPSEAALELIRNAKHPREALDAVRACWHPIYGSFSEEMSDAEREVCMAEPGGRYYRFATGGWSGCEEAISELRRNFVGSYTWRMSGVGGVHIYEYPSYPEPSDD